MTTQPVTESAVITVTVNSPYCLGVSPNERVHWGERRRRNAAARAAAFTGCSYWEATTTGARLKLRFPVDPVVLDIEIVWPKGRKRLDPDNAWAALKSTIDGLVDAGVIASDAPDHLRLRELRQSRDPKAPWPRIVARVSPMETA